jgi:3-oxoadipate enol-lactonase
VRLHHVVDGPPDAAPLLMASSLGTTHEMWAPQVGPLAERFRVVRCDRRGHGGSPVAKDPTTLDDLGADLLELLDLLELERVSFCGLSLGGLEGMWLAVNAPERVDRLALCCTRAVFPPREKWVDRAATVRAGGMAAIADGVLEGWFRSDFHESSPGAVSRFRQMLLATPVDGYAACCGVLADADLSARLGEIVARTLVVTGADDPTVPPEAGDALAAAIPDAAHVVVQAAAHLANVEQPGAFTAALLRHLSTEEGSP